MWQDNSRFLFFPVGFTHSLFITDNKTCKWDVREFDTYSLETHQSVILSIETTLTAIRWSCNREQECGLSYLLYQDIQHIIFDSNINCY